MQKSKNLYLLLIIIIFLILWIPYFQNVTTTGDITFFFSKTTFIGIYPLVLFLGIVEGALITLYVNALLGDMKKEEPKKFDL